MEIKFTTARLTNIVMEVIAATLIIVFSVSVYNASESMTTATTQKLDMLKTAFALQQSSEDLTKFVGDYIITNDKKYKNNFNQVAQIRNGISKRPTLFNSSYWYLPEDVKIDNHPLTEPSSLTIIIESLPFTELELLLIQESHFESDELVALEHKIFLLVENGKQEEALKVYYSPEYYHSKVIIMSSLDKLYQSLNERFTREIKELQKEQLDALIRLFVVIFLLTIFKMILPTSYTIRD